MNDSLANRPSLALGVGLQLGLGQGAVGEATKTERCQVVAGPGLHGQFTQDLADDWSQLKPMT